MAYRILVVDDELLLLKGLIFTLKQEGFETDTAEDGETALKMIETGKYDVVLLDIMLPGLDGTEVCQRIRMMDGEVSNTPIIFLTAKDADIDKIMGLENGADDYITKPYNTLVVKARVKSILRRATVVRRDDVRSELQIREMQINLSNRSVSVRGRDINLTAKEFDLLQLFVSERGKVFSREELLSTIWKYDYLGDLRTVDVHIRRLREKIEKNPADPEYVLTKWGVGYYFTDKD